MPSRRFIADFSGRVGAHRARVDRSAARLGNGAAASADLRKCDCCGSGGVDQRQETALSSIVAPRGPSRAPAIDQGPIWPPAWRSASIPRSNQVGVRFVSPRKCRSAVVASSPAVVDAIGRRRAPGQIQTCATRGRMRCRRAEYAILLPVNMHLE